MDLMAQIRLNSREALYMQYLEAIAFTKNLLKKSKPLGICAEDIVHDAYLEGALTEKRLTALYFKAKHFCAIEWQIKKAPASRAYTRHCKGCDDAVPISGFRMVKHCKIKGFLSPAFRCIPCEREYSRKRAVIYRQNRTKISEVNKRFYQKKLTSVSGPAYRKKLNDLAKQYYSIASAGLTDLYIKAVLRSKGIMAAQVTPTLIRKQKADLIKYRKKKRNKLLHQQSLHEHSGK